MRELPIAKAEAVLAGRRRMLTRKQWIVESVGYSYFWKDVAKSSIVPFFGVFIGCMVIGALQLRREGT